uniref:Uncharacterized protein n=1 Tax=Panagrolaimus sp. ES5 TaxID=591445 RepID=A0AC34GXC7_9BILA
MFLFGFSLALFTVTSTFCQPIRSLFNNYVIDSIIPTEFNQQLIEYNKPDSMPIISRSMLEADKGQVSRASISNALSNMRNVVSQMPNIIPEKRSNDMSGYDYFLSNEAKTPYNHLFTPIQQRSPFKRAFKQMFL